MLFLMTRFEPDRGRIVERRPVRKHSLTSSNLKIKCIIDHDECQEILRFGLKTFCISCCVPQAPRQLSLAIRALNRTGAAPGLSAGARSRQAMIMARSRY